LPVVTHGPPVALRVPDEHREQAFAHLLLGAPRGDLTGDFDEPLPLTTNSTGGEFCNIQRAPGL
jgi:hypothetical protein